MQQAGGLRIDSLPEGNYLFANLTQGVGLGPSTSTQNDEDVAMVCEYDLSLRSLYRLILVSRPLRKTRLVFHLLKRKKDRKIHLHCS